MKPIVAYISAGATAGVVLLALGLLSAVTGTVLPFTDWAREGQAQDERATTIRPPSNGLLAQNTPFPARSGGSAGRGDGAGVEGRASGGSARGGGQDPATQPPDGVTAPPAQELARPPVSTPQAQEQRAPGTAPTRNPLPVSVPGSGARQPGTTQQLTNGLADTTKGLTDQTAGTLKRVSPQLGQTVTDTGRGVSDLVRGLGGAPPR